MTKTKTNLDPWEKQEHETSKAYAAFCTYRGMGTDRSLAKQAAAVNSELAGSSLTAKVRQLTKWSSKYNWVARVKAYDVYLEAKERKKKESDIVKQAKNHNTVANLALQKAVERIKTIGVGDIKELTPKEALEYMKAAVDIGRKSLGVPDQIVELGGEVKGSGVVIYLPDNTRDESTADDTQTGTEDN